MQTKHEFLAALYVKFRKQFYLDYMHDIRVLSAYTLGDNPSEYMQWFPCIGNIQHTAADVCSNCGCNFGPTVGGRLRYSCYDCRSTRNSISQYEIQELSLLWGCSQYFVEFLLANAISLQKVNDVTSKFKTSFAQRSSATTQMSEEVSTPETNR